MNQIPSHSQMPTFVKNESNTKPVLYQYPPSSEQLAKSNKRAQVKADAKDLGLFIGVSLVMWFAITVLLSFVIGG